MNNKLIQFIFWSILISAFVIGIHFEYTQEGQNKWMKNYAQCAGKWQSPIIIAASRSVPLPLPALEMVGYHNFLPSPLKLNNNGHTVSVTIENHISKNQTPYIFGALLKENQMYKLESFHFHWGLKNSRGSEHILHGTRYPMEMHLIHRNMKYPNIVAALQHEDGLSVLGIFFHLQEEDNGMLISLISHLSEIQLANSETQLNNSLILAWLLPRNMDTYYTYRGSLTTPPCYEVVTWTVFADSVPISYKQMNRFRLLSNGRGILADNYRFPQDLGSRKVYVRRVPSVYKKNEMIKDMPISTLKWSWP